MTAGVKRLRKNNVAWLNSYIQAAVCMLQRKYSDYSPVLLSGMCVGVLFCIQFIKEIIYQAAISWLIKIQKYTWWASIFLKSWCQTFFQYKHFYWIILFIITWIKISQCTFISLLNIYWAFKMFQALHWELMTWSLDHEVI